MQYNHHAMEKVAWNSYSWWVDANCPRGLVACNLSPYDPVFSPSTATTCCFIFKNYFRLFGVTSFFCIFKKKKETLTILWTHNLCKVVASGFLLLGQNLRSSRAPGPCTVCSPASDHDGNTLKSQEAFKLTPADIHLCRDLHYFLH